MSYRADYPSEPIGGGNPYHRCTACGRSAPEINGRIEGHYEGCSWRQAQESMAGAAANTADDTATKALWAKCDKCGHCWPAAYYPIDLMSMGRVLKGCKCPRGCVGKPLLAKQDNGVLQEPEAGAAPAKKGAA